MRIIFLLLIIGFSVQMTIAQDVVTKKTVNGKAKSLYERAVTYSSNGVYHKAQADLEKVVKLAPNFIDAHLQMAIVFYDTQRYLEAEQSFEKAIALDAEYKRRVYYMLASAEAKQEKYLEAVANYKAFVDRANPKSETEQNLKKRAERHIQNYTFIAQAKANPVPFDPQSLGKSINTSDSEYLPSLTADGGTMIYTKRIRGQEDFYSSTFENGEWSLGIPLIGVNHPKSNEGAQSISADGRLLVFTKCGEMDGYGECDIYFSEIKNGRWTPPANMGTPINTRAWDAQPSLSADGKTIYFASTRSGGKGKSDIWVSHRTQNGKWQTPVNLSDAINTPLGEQTPFIHPDGSTLYFMANSHPGMGSWDLFYSRHQEDGTWDAPINMGYPINTEGHEGAMIVSLDGKTAYFASDRDFDAEGKLQKLGHTDIYSFELYEAARPNPVTYVKATVKDALTGKRLQSSVEVVRHTNSEIYTSSTTDSDGEFLVCLPLGENYGLNVSKKGYLFHSENFALDKSLTLEEPFLLEISLYPIPEESTLISAPEKAEKKAIILKNIFFETGSSELLSTSFTELERLYKLLLENAQLNIQINGHTDNIGSDADNLQLSNDRAKAVVDWLTEKGITPERLSAKGFGETQPIANNDTEEGRQSNRRTEFIVL